MSSDDAIQSAMPDNARAEFHGVVTNTPAQIIFDGGKPVYLRIIGVWYMFQPLGFVLLDDATAVTLEAQYHFMLYGSMDKSKLN